MAKNQELLEIIDLIGQTLNEARPYGLQTEVIASTIQQIQKNPKIDLSVALQNALTDWDL